MKYLGQSSYYYLEGRFEVFAQSQGYNCSAYGQGDYGECTTALTGSSSGPGGLANTGFAIGLVVGTAALLVFVTVLVMMLRRKDGKKTANKTNEAPKSTPQQPVQKQASTDIINSGKE